MSRGKARNRRRNKTINAGKRLPKTTGESSKSRRYEEGKTFGYTSRIRGKVSPVTVTHMDPNDM